MSGGPFGRKGRRPDEDRPGESPPQEAAPPPEPRKRPRVQPRATGPVPGRRPRAPTFSAPSMTWLVGVVCVLVLAYITLNTIATEGSGSRGVGEDEQVPPFAMPLAGSPIDRDANLRMNREDGHPAACEVRGPGVLNICELYEQGPVALAFIATRSKRCLEQVDVIERVYRRHPDVRFAAVSVRGDRGGLRWDVLKKRWTFPIGYDSDGAVANSYSVAVCPTITFMRKGGAVVETSLTFLDEQELAAVLEQVRRAPPPDPAKRAAPPE